MEIEAIKIDVSASVKGENKIDRLAQKLEALGNALKGIPQDVVDKLERLGSAANFQMGKGPTQLASAIKKICDQSDKLGGVVDEMGRLASYDFSNLADASEGIKAAARSANRTSGAESMTPMTSGTSYREAQEASAAYNDEADAADNASGAVREHADESVRAARKIEKHTSALGKAVKAFGRILAYRAIRSVIKEIGQAFAEGRNNLVRYSDALHNLDSAKADENMTKMATAALYAKNSLGAMLGPVIQSLVPIVQQLVQWLAIGTNAINQFVSALQGKTTFTKAKEYVYDYAESLKKAGKTAKEVKAYLMPFDELNVLPDNNDKSGGSYDDNLDYSKMFEEVEINNKLLDFIDNKLKPSIEWIKQHMDEILTVAGAIGTAILGWNFSKAFLKNLPGVGGFAKNIAKQLGLDKALEIGIGIVLAVTGLVMSWEGAYNVGLKGWDQASIKDKLMTILGPLVTGAGGALIGGAIAGVPGALIGFAIGVGISLIVEGIAFSQGRGVKMSLDAFYESEFGQRLKELKDKISQNGIEIDEIRARIKNIKADFENDSWKRPFERAKQLIDEIFEMDAKDNKTAEQIQVIKNKINELNNMGYGTIIEGFDDVTQHVIGTRDAAQELIDKLMEEYKLEAYRDNIVEAYKAQADAEKALKDADDNLRETFNLKRDIEQEIAGIEAEIIRNTRDWDGSVAELIETNMELRSQQDDLKVGLEETNKELENAKEKYRNANDAVNEANDLIDELKESVKGIKGVADTAASDFDKDTNKMVDSVRNAVKDINNELSKIVAEIKTKVKLDIEAKNAGKMVSVATPYASGGYVSDGELFMAREAGPEMVGRIGSRNAVANNDQIVAGIASGVEEANEPVVNAVLAIGAQIVGAIRESGGNGITVDDIARGVTRWQARQARAVGV